MPSYREILNFQLPENDANAGTVLEYLLLLGLKVWEEDEGFSGKRPFGNSGWSGEITQPLIDAGLVYEEDADQEVRDAFDTYICNSDGA